MGTLKFWAQNRPNVSRTFMVLRKTINSCLDFSAVPHKYVLLCILKSATGF